MEYLLFNATAATDAAAAAAVVAMVNIKLG